MLEYYLNIILYLNKANDMEKGGRKTCLKVISIFIRLMPEGRY